MKTQTGSRPVILRGRVRDVLRSVSTVTERLKRMKRGSPQRPTEGAVIELTDRLHPQRQRMTVIRMETPEPGTRIYHLAMAEPDGPPPAPFRAGSYLSVSCPGPEGGEVSRPYSICSTPSETATSGDYILCIGESDPGFVSSRILEEWRPGSDVTVSDPRGSFSFERLRDGDNLVFVAGGTGITPFRSLAGDILENHADTRITLFHGARNRGLLLFREYFRDLAARYGHRFRYIPVLSEERDPSCREGLIDAALISAVLGGEPASAAFLCGPRGLHDHFDSQLPELSGLIRRVRREDFGSNGTATSGSRFKLEVRINDQRHRIPADPGETVLVALERAGLRPPSSCRTGTCGFCRSRLIRGTALYDPDHPGIRRADRVLGYFHPCIAMPGSDMIMEIPSRSPEDGIGEE